MKKKKRYRETELQLEIVMAKRQKSLRQLSLDLPDRVKSRQDKASSEGGKRKVVTFVDAGTRAARQDAIRRVQDAGVFDRTSAKR